MMFLQIEVISETLPVILEWRIAGVLFIIIIFLFWLLWKHFKEEIRLLREEVKRLGEEKEVLTHKIISISEDFNSKILSHEKENLQSINDVTNSLSNLIIHVQDINRKIN